MKTLVAPGPRWQILTAGWAILVLAAVTLFTSCGVLQRIKQSRSQTDTRETAVETGAEETPSGIQYSALSSSDIAGQFPYALTYDKKSKTLFYTDILNNVICRRTADGSIALLNQSARLGLSTPLALDHVSSAMLVIADTGNKRICGLTFDGNASELIKTNGRVTGIVVVRGDAIYYSNYDACTVMKTTAQGEQTVVVGTGSAGYSGDGGPGTEASLNGPYGLAHYGDRQYLADSLNHRIRVLNLKSGIVQTFAGNGTRGTSIPSSPVNGLDVALNEPRGVSVDEEGNVYVSNTFGNSILCFDPDGQLLVEMVKEEWSENDQPACAVAVDNHLVYTDLTTPGIRWVTTAKAVPEPVKKAKPKPEEKPKEETPPTPEGTTETKPAQAEKPEQEAKPTAQAPQEPQTQKPAEKPAPPKPEPPRPTGPKVTRAYVTGPNRILGEPSVSYTLCTDLAIGTEAAGIVCEVKWNPEHFELISVVPHQGPIPNSRRTHFSQEEDRITFTVHARAGTPPLSGAVSLADLLFKCVWTTDSPVLSKIEVAKPSILAADGTESSGESRVFSVTNFLYGDANHDNKVDMVDVVLLLKDVKPRSDPGSWDIQIAGDVDLDSVLTIADAFATSRRAADPSWELPTLPPRNKAKWSYDDSLFQDALSGELTDWGEIDRRKNLRSSWEKKLAEEGAVLFVDPVDPVTSNDQEILLDLLADLPKGKSLGAFEAALLFDPARVEVEEVLLDEQGPMSIVGTANIGDNRIHLGGICRSPLNATETTVKLATLLVRIDTPGSEPNWDSILRPVARELIDYSGSVMLGFGVPTRIRGYLPGDVNQDGKADSVDVLILLESIVGKNKTGLRSTDAADMDDDGTHTIRDAILLFRSAKGEALFDLTKPEWKRIAAEHAVRALFERKTEDTGLLPPMVDLIPEKAQVKSITQVAQTHGILGLDGPPTTGESGHFLGTLLYQPCPNTSLGGYLQVLQCDPPLTIESVMPAPAMESINQPLVYSVSSDRRRLLISQILNLDDSSDSKPVNLAAILFKMDLTPSASPTSSRIDLSSLGLVDRFGKPVDVICPSHTVSNFLPGDVNGDGSVERLDEVLLMRVVAGEVGTDSLKNPDAADLNLDGEVDFSDVVLLEQATLGEPGGDVVRRARRRSAILDEIEKEQGVRRIGRGIKKRASTPSDSPPILTGRQKIRRRCQKFPLPEGCY